LDFRLRGNDGENATFSGVIPAKAGIQENSLISLLFALCMAKQKMRQTKNPL